MNADEFAADWTHDLRAWQDNSPRSAQKDLGLIGASDFDCREKMRRVMLRLPETDYVHKWSAYVGTAIDKENKLARAAAKPHLILDAEWPVNLNGFVFNVHPDEADPTEPSVTDAKSKDGLALVRSKLEKDPNRIQRHLQYHAGVQNGVLPAEGITRNVYVDRSGDDPTVHVEQEPYNLDVVAQAESILEDVLYAIANDETASQDRPRNWCEQFCPFFSDCRGSEIRQEVIEDESVITLVEAYSANHALIKDAAQLEEELKRALRGVGGETPSGLVATWTQVNGKTPYLKFTVKPKREPRRRQRAA